MSQLASRYWKLLGRVLPLFAIWAATLIAVALLIIGDQRWGAALAVIVLAAVSYRRLRRQAGAEVGARAALTLALGSAASRLDGWDATILISVAILLLVVMAEPSVEAQAEPSLVAHQLPPLRQPLLAKARPPLFATNVCGTLVLAGGASGLLPRLPVAVAVGALTAFGLGVAGYQLRRRRAHRPEREIRAALLKWDPNYYLHFDGKPESAYQLQMWLPYLAETGARGALIIRNRRFLPQALRITDLPVIFAEKVEPLEQLMVPGLGAIFYVNNSPRNVDGTRYPQAVHVHLGHGDSDKPSSYAASTAMFDRIFVAGQAGADRFASHGVEVPQSKFVLVGRPQVEAIQVRDADIAMASRPVVLYAPTWRGVLADMQLSSLDRGAQIVQALLDANARVIFRPHPFSARDAASRVLIKQIDGLLQAAAQQPQMLSTEATKLSIFECLNASDALVTDISSVASDYLYSNKPLAVTHRGDPATVEAAYPLAQAAQLLAVDAELGPAVRRWLTEDSQATARAEVRRYYLGPWDEEEYPKVFVAAARDAIRAGQQTQASQTRRVR